MKHSYKFIIVRDDSEQRELTATFSKENAQEFNEAHGLSIEKEIAKYIGLEIERTIREWEEKES